MTRHYEEEEDDDIPAQGKEMGMLPLSTIPYSIQSNRGYATLPIKKSRARQQINAQKTPTRVNNMRDVSVSTAMSMLHISEEPRKVRQSEHQAISDKMKQPPTPGSCQKASISTGLRNFRIGSSESALVLFQDPKGGSVAPKTPSQIPVPFKSEAMITTPATPSRTPKTCPSQNNFLTKSSNIPGFVAFDVEGRLEDMKSMYDKLVDRVGETDAQRTGFHEAQELYKLKSKLLP